LGWILKIKNECLRKSGLVSGALALILMLGVGGFTAFASEVDMEAFVSGFPSLCSGDGFPPPPPPPPRPGCVCGGGGSIGPSPICGWG